MLFPSCSSLSFAALRAFVRFSLRTKNKPNTTESIERIAVTASHVQPIPTQKLTGYMQMSRESLANVQVPAAKNSEWNAVNSPSKSTAAHSPSTAKSASESTPEYSRRRPTERGPNR